MIYKSFDSELKQEIEDSKQKYQLLKFVCEANMVMAEYQYSSLSMGAFKMVFDKTLKHVENNDGFAMLDSAGEILFASSDEYNIDIPIDKIQDNENKYIIQKNRTIEFLGYIEYKGGRIYVAYCNDISAVFDNRDEQLRYFFVANFAHELKTPMTSIIGYADMLRSKKLSDDSVFEAASFIFSEGKRLESLSLKLMELIVLSKQDFELETIDIYELTEKVSVAVLPIMQKYGLTLSVHSEHCVVKAEQDLLKTLLINLIDNARKASDGGKIELYAKKVGDKCRVTVKDYGRGMDEAELSRITEAFYMVDKSRSRAQHGAGLGLAICERIAELHGTKLEFSSAPHKGTSVTIELEVK